MINDYKNLVIKNSELFRHLIIGKPITYLTINEYAEKHDKARGIIARYCRQGRFEGAINKGTVWLIPEDAPYPDDYRVGARLPDEYRNKR